MKNKKKMKNIDHPCPDHEKCIHVIHLIMDGEANKEEEAFFYSHVRDCLDCAQYYTLEQSIREAIRKKLEIKVAPDELIEEVRRKVQESLTKPS